MNDDGLLNVLEDVMNSLINIVDVDGNRLFKGVDIWRSQFELIGNNSDQKNRGKNEYFPYQWPVCFVEPQVHWIDTRDRGTQRQNCTIILHIGIWRLDLEKNDNWKIPFLLRTAAHQAVQTLKVDDTYTSLVKSIEYQDSFYENFYVWKMEYTTMVVDSTAFWGRDNIDWKFDKYNIEKNINK